MIGVKQKLRRNHLIAYSRVGKKVVLSVAVLVLLLKVRIPVYLFIVQNENWVTFELKYQILRYEIS